MPIPVNLDVYNPAITNLIPSQIAQRQQKLAEQQSQVENWNKVLQVLSQIVQRNEQQAFLKKLGVITETPETKEAAVGTPEWNKFAQQMMAKGTVVTPESGAVQAPTGRMTRGFDPTKLPAGMEISDLFGTGVGIKGQQPKQFDYSDLIPIMKYQTLQKYMDESGNVDFGRMTPEEKRFVGASTTQETDIKISASDIKEAQKIVPFWERLLPGTQTEAGKNVIELRKKLIKQRLGKETKPENIQQIDDKISSRIAELRQQGMSDMDIANALKEKGINPTLYGLK